MIRSAALAVLAAVLVLPAGAHAASVRVMVAGKARVLEAPRTVRLKARSVRIGGRRCAVAARTPLSALLGTGAGVRLRDEFASCGRSPRNSGGLFVTAVGGEANRGRDGWVYKVGTRAGTTGAADPSGPFGAGPLRGGRDVLWFWCVLDRGDSCQRTLALRAPKAVKPGAALRVSVRGYDDRGHGVPVAGARVQAGRATAITGADGAATLRAPSARGAVRVRASRSGLVPSFPARVAVR